MQLKDKTFTIELDLNEWDMIRICLGVCMKIFKTSGSNCDCHIEHDLSNDMDYLKLGDLSDNWDSLGE